jgi:hypothetical protein
VDEIAALVTCVASELHHTAVHAQRRTIGDRRKQQVDSPL